MTIKRWTGAAYADVASAKRWNGTAWVDLTVCKRWDGAAWVDIALPGSTPALSVTITPGSAYGEILDSTPPYATAVTVTSNAVTATAIGGTGTPSFTWTRLSGSTAIYANLPNAASTNFEASLLRNRTASGIFQVTCVRGAETATATVSVNLAYLTGDLA